MSGLLSTITKAVASVSGDRAEGDNEARRPLLMESDESHVSKNEGRSGNPQQPTGSQRSMQKTVSLLELRKHARTERSMKDHAQSSIHSRPPVNPTTSPLPPCAEGRRSFSNPQHETRSCSDRTDYSDTIMQQELIARLRGIRGANTFKRSKEKTDSSATTMMRMYRYGTHLERRLWKRPNSDRDLRRTFRASDNLIKPLKTCLKQNIKSAHTTPPDGIPTLSRVSLEEQKLRRRKTVDFAEAISESVLSRGEALIRASEYRKQERTKLSIQASLCPGAAMLSRRLIASPAVTRTDVHVIAITPSSSKSMGLGLGRTQLGQDRDDPATPIMQIVESSNDSYQVVWDDVPPEQNTNPRRRSCSAGEALQALSTDTRDLERVNTKLTEWSSTWKTPSQHFKPMIVVFPDDGCGPHFECAIVDDEEIEIFAPPNSERVSAVHSRYASRPTSASMSREPSQDGSSTILFTQDTLLGGPSLSVERPHVVPDPEAWPAYLVAAPRNLGVPSPERKLSNLEEADIKFRNHRDSVTLAYSRLIHSGGLRPELFAHKDLVTMAKKLMHAQHHAASTSRHLHHLRTRSEQGSLPDMDGAIPPLPVMKASAIDAFQKDTPAPILRRPKRRTAAHSD